MNRAKTKEVKVDKNTSRHNNEKTEASGTEREDT